VRKKKERWKISRTHFFDMVGNPHSKDAVIAKLLEEAPAELRPILIILKSGKKLAVGDFAEENLKPLLELSNRHGVDIVWKDLALLIYASYPTRRHLG
jgi:hypothetical protein